MLDTLSLEMKEELLEYLEADIATSKAAPKRSYLEEQWAEIKRLIESLKYEPYIDDQIEIEEIWDICEKMIKSGNLKKEPWEIRQRVLKSIIGGEYYDYYGVYDPMKDLFQALLLTSEERIEAADIIFEIGSEYMKEDCAKLYRDCGQPQKYFDYIEMWLKDKEEPYMELISYYRNSNRDKAVSIAELGMKKCKDDQTDLIIFMIQCAREDGDVDKEQRLLKSARARRKVDMSKVLEALN